MRDGKWRCVDDTLVPCDEFGKGVSVLVVRCNKRRTNRAFSQLGVGRERRRVSGGSGLLYNWA